MTTEILSFLERYWPILVGVIMVILAFGETRVSVFFNSTELEQQAKTNSTQWRTMSQTKEKLNDLILNHENRISKLEVSCKKD